VTTQRDPGLDSPPRAPRRVGAIPRGWLLGVFAVVACTHLWFISQLGTDVPFHDQWDSEGRRLYPQFLDGSLRFEYFWRPHNEHRITWTHGLNLLLFWANGQWDPLVQMAAGALLCAAAAALVGAVLADLPARWARGVILAAVAVAFLPHLAWHNVLWGFQSQVYFCVLFSVLALLAFAREPTIKNRLGASLFSLASFVAMGAGGLVPFAMLAWMLADQAHRRRPWAEFVRRNALVFFLVPIALALRPGAPADLAAEWQAKSVGEFLDAFVRVAAWPHFDQPLAAIVMQAPFLCRLGWRFLRRTEEQPTNDAVLLVGLWALLCAAAMAFARGGGWELAIGVPSRYVDFTVLLPLVNLWCLLAFVTEKAAPRRAWAGAIVLWAAFGFVGWMALSAEVARGLIRPRMKDRAAPERLMRAYQGDRRPEIFAGQPRLYIPHPALSSVDAVLDDPRLNGKLPPSLQPDRPMGPISRWVRTILARP
jgi:hypothetical protein